MNENDGRIMHGPPTSSSVSPTLHLVSFVTDRRSVIAIPLSRRQYGPSLSLDRRSRDNSARQIELSGRWYIRAGTHWPAVVTGLAIDTR